MKALSLIPHTRNLKLIETTEPNIESPLQVKVKVLEVGICGTDREEAMGGRADAPEGEKSLIIGHEMLGEVVSCGEKVTKFKPKDLVVTMVRRPCSECLCCQHGAFDFCSSGLYSERGIKQRHGFDAEYIVDEEKYMVLVPPSLRSLGVLTEPMTVVEKAIDHACRLQHARMPFFPEAEHWLQGKKALVAGLGPIGLLAAFILRLRGAEVFGTDLAPPHSLRPQILEEIGGKYIQNKLHTIEKMDLIVEAAGVPKLDFSLFSLLAINGIYVLTGVPAEGPPLEVDGSQILKQLVLKNQVLFGSVNANRSHFERAILDFEEASQKWPKALDKLITKKVGCTEFEKAFSQRGPDEIKTVLQW